MAKTQTENNSDMTHCSKSLQWIDNHVRVYRRDVTAGIGELENRINTMKEQCEKEMSLYEEEAKVLKQGSEFNSSSSHYPHHLR